MFKILPPSSVLSINIVVLEPGNGGERDTFLADNNIETFLIVGKSKPQQQPQQPQSNLSGLQTSAVQNGSFFNFDSRPIYFVKTLTQLDINTKLHNTHTIQRLMKNIK